MPDIPKIFKPRRGDRSVMTTGSRKNIILEAGEMFIEVPDTGQGTGHCRMKMGDGRTTYSDLPYAMGDTENDIINYTDDDSNTAIEALNKLSSGKPLWYYISILIKAVYINTQEIADIKNRLGY